MLCYVMLCYVCTYIAWRKHLYYMSAEVAALLIYSMHPTGPGRRALRSRSICTPLCPTRASTPYWGNTGGWWRLPCLKTRAQGRATGFWDEEFHGHQWHQAIIYIYQIDCKAWNMVSRHEKRFSFIKFGQWQFHVLHSNGVQPCLGLMFLALISMNISMTISTTYDLSFWHLRWPYLFVARRAGGPQRSVGQGGLAADAWGTPRKALSVTRLDVCRC